MAWDSIFGDTRQQELRHGWFRDHKIAHEAAQIERYRRGHPVELKKEFRRLPFRQAVGREYYILLDDCGEEIRFQGWPRFMPHRVH